MTGEIRDDRGLMRAHIAALYLHDERGRLTHVNDPGRQRAPRFYLGRTRDGVEWRVRDDVTDAGLIEELRALWEARRAQASALLGPEASAPYEAVLGRQAPVQRVWTGPAYCFPPAPSGSEWVVRVTNANASLLQAYLAAWLEDVPINQPLFALVIDGAAVAVCASVRQTAAAHEAGVETAPAFRGRGYAREVVAAWAQAVREHGVTPLYSTSWANTASQAVARKLGLRQFGADLHIT